QKGGLKGVFGVVVVADDTTANAKDHRTVTTDKGCKGHFVLLVDEGRQQLSVRPLFSILPQHGLAKMPDHRVQLSRRHTCPPWPVAFDLYLELPGRSRLYTLFSFRPSSPMGLSAGRSPPRGRRRNVSAPGTACGRRRAWRRRGDRRGRTPAACPAPTRTGRT